MIYRGRTRSLKRRWEIQQLEYHKLSHKKREKIVRIWLLIFFPFPFKGFSLINIGKHRFIKHTKIFFIPSSFLMRIKKKRLCHPEMDMIKRPYCIFRRLFVAVSCKCGFSFSGSYAISGLSQLEGFTKFISLFFLYRIPLKSHTDKLGMRRDDTFFSHFFPPPSYFL